MKIKVTSINTIVLQTHRDSNKDKMYRDFRD